MTLSEIETILLELSARHPNLTQELLSTLLMSAGWEEKSIKEAIVLYNQQGGIFKVNAVTPLENVPVPAPEKEIPPTTKVALEDSFQTGNNPASVTPNVPQVSDLTFYQQDGTEEGELKVFADIPSAKQNSGRVEKKDAITFPIVTKPNIQQTIIEPLLPPINASKQGEFVLEKTSQELPANVAVPIAPLQKPELLPQSNSPVYVVPTTEPQSLITHDEVAERRLPEKNIEIPNNLPLLPFESSPHIWSFSKYKDVFHGANPASEEIKVITVMPQVEKMPAAPTSLPQVEQKRAVVVVQDEEVVIESVPFRKDDKPLVFLAATMLLAIILILGYMYSNGRL